MWSVLINGAVELVNSWFETKKAKQQAEVKMHQQLANIEADWDLVAQQQAQYSLKDEFLTIVWCAPLIIAWFEPEKAQAWVDFVTELPMWYQFGLFGILSASFGLRWYFKQQNFKVKSIQNE